MAGKSLPIYLPWMATAHSYRVVSADERQNILSILSTFYASPLNGRLLEGCAKSNEPFATHSTYKYRIQYLRTIPLHLCKTGDEMAQNIKTGGHVHVETLEIFLSRETLENMRLRLESRIEDCLLLLE